MANTINDMENFYNELHSLSESGIYDTTSNFNRAHNTTMLRYMLDHSGNVKMYCGEMSVLRKDFYDEIDRENTESSEALGAKLKVLLIKSLENFIAQNNHRFSIIVEHFSPQFMNDLIDRKLFQLGIDKGVISIKKLNLEKIQTAFLTHFSISDTKMLRLETNKKLHEAICAFNMDESINKDYDGTFGKLEQLSEAIG